MLPVRQGSSRCSSRCLVKALEKPGSSLGAADRPSDDEIKVLGEPGDDPHLLQARAALEHRDARVGGLDRPECLAHPVVLLDRQGGDAEVLGCAGHGRLEDGRVRLSPQRQGSGTHDERKASAATRVRGSTSGTWSDKSRRPAALSKAASRARTPPGSVDDARASLSAMAPSSASIRRSRDQPSDDGVRAGTATCDQRGT